MWANFPQSKQSEREVGGSCSTFYGLPSRVTPITSTLFCALDTNCQVQPTPKGREARLHLLKGGVSKNVWIYLKITAAFSYCPNKAVQETIGKPQQHKTVFIIHASEGSLGSYPDLLRAHLHLWGWLYLSKDNRLTSGGITSDTDLILVWGLCHQYNYYFK